MSDPITHRDIPFASAAADDERYARRVAALLETERARREARRLLDAETRALVLPPVIETLRDRLARPRPITRWRIHGWHPRNSRVMLTAQFKAGKTTAIGNYARCLVDGDLWLGRDVVEPIAGTLVLIDTEMGASQLDEWMLDQRIQHDDRVIVLPLRGRVASLNLLDEEVRRQWAARFRAHDVEVLILDCLRPVLDVLGLDEHHEAGRFLVAIDALMADAGIAEALVVHHMGHTGERSRGDSRLRDWPDVEWRLVRQDDDPASPRFLTAYGRDVDQPESQLTYESDTRRLVIAGGSRREMQTSAALGVVLDVLRTSPGPLSARAILTALAESEHPRDTIRGAIRQGVRDGIIATEQGARRAILHRVRECAGVRDECAALTASECAAASIEARTRTLIDEGLSARTDSAFRFDPSSAFLPPGEA